MLAAVGRIVPEGTTTVMPVGTGANGMNLTEVMSYTS